VEVDVSILVSFIPRISEEEVASARLDGPPETFYLENLAHLK